jgi:long-chain acyl-CoA synthetase
MGRRLSGPHGRVALAGASMEELLTKTDNGSDPDGSPESIDLMTLPAPSAPSLAVADPVDPIWLKSYPADVPAQIDPDRYPSLHAMLAEACRRNAARPAFESLSARMTYAEWDRDSRAFAAFLREAVECRAGDRVAIMLPNMLAYPVAFLGTLRAGLIVVNVNPLYTARELKEQLADSGASVIVIMENFAHKLEAVIGDTAIRHVVVARLGDFVPTLKRWAFNFANSYIERNVPAWRFDNFTMLQDACTREPGADYADADTGRDAVALLQYTGGTTGVPKGAMLTHRNLIANTLQCLAWTGADQQQGPEQRVLTPLPLYHIYSLTANLLSFSAVGALNILVIDPRNLDRLVRTMRDVRPTVMSGVNTLYNALVHRDDFAALDFSPLRLALGGGAAVQGEVAQRWRAITGIEVTEGYGLTEASPVVCLNPSHAPKRGTVGTPMPSTEITIRDDHGAVLGVGDHGEVWVRGPQVMLGYWRRPDESAAVLTADGWLRTGDIGELDGDGYLKLLDRKKDMIIVSGFKVFPNEVEDVVMQHPDVREAAAIGVPDDRTGQAVKLFVVKADARLSEADLRAFLRERLVNYKVPHAIVFRDALPKSNIGKILRKELH